MSRGERKAMIRRDQPGLSLSRQCEILAISRSSLYYTLKGESPANLALMRRIDELFLQYPFYGSRQMVRQLRREGVCIGRHPGDQQSAVRRVDRGVRLRAPDRRVAGPSHPPCPYPGDERRQLSAQPKPNSAGTSKKHLIGLKHQAHG